MGGITIIGIIYALAIFWLVNMYMKNKKKSKQRQDMLANLSKDDEIITYGGLHGTIVEVLEIVVKLRIAKGVIITLEKGSIATVINTKEESSEK